MKKTNSIITISIVTTILILICIYLILIKPVLYKNYFKNTIINPTLVALDLYSDSASNLLIGTAMQESCLGRLSNNIFQIKLNTAQDINTNYLAYRPALYKAVMKLYNNSHSLEWNLNNNINYQVALARIVYQRSHGELPNASNSKALAEFWKNNYNTYLGRGTASQFQSIYDNYLFVGFSRCIVKYWLYAKHDSK